MSELLTKYKVQLYRDNTLVHHIVHNYSTVLRLITVQQILLALLINTVAKVAPAPPNTNLKRVYSC